MKELLEQALISYNLPLTVALGLVVLFWCISLLGIFDMDVFNVELDVDLDSGADIGTGSGLHSILRFFNADAVPTTMIFSLLALFMWGGSLTLNYYLNPSQNELVAFGLLLLNLFVSLMVVKVVTQPLKPLFKKLKESDELEEPIIGAVGVVRSQVLDSSYGQVEVKRSDGTVALINAKLSSEKKSLIRGSQVLVFEKTNKSVYLVREAKELAKS